MRTAWVVALGVLLAGGFADTMRAQSSVPQPSMPQTYSFTEDPAISIMAPTIITVYRDGAKELVDQVMPPSPGRPHTFHARLLYDFEAHTIYTRIVSDPATPCSVMNYTSPEFDTISGAQHMMADFAGDGVQAKPMGTETVNGIATKVTELTAPQPGQGSAKLWVAEQGGFPVKMVMTDPDGKQTTMIEMKRLSFAKPAASLFVPPAGCQQIQGEATETGAHAVIGTGAGHAAAAPPSTKVTDVTFHAIPDYTGACPAHLRVTGTITTDGPGKVWYQFAAGMADPAETVVFQAAGTKTVTHVFTVKVDPTFGNFAGGSAMLEAVMEDAKGGHDEFSAKSANANFSVNCKR